MRKLFESDTYLVCAAPLAQLDRASGYEPEGREFESLRARHFFIRFLVKAFPPQFFDFLMEQALIEAKSAYALGDVPVGAVVAVDGQIVAKAHNEIEARGDATRHAEILAIQRASEVQGGWRLDNAVLCVTLEPCPMCASAMKLARIPVLAFGARDENRGALGSIFDIGPDLRIGPEPRVIAGVRAEECAAILQEFFREKRRRRE